MHQSISLSFPRVDSAAYNYLQAAIAIPPGPKPIGASGSSEPTSSTRAAPSKSPIVEPDPEVKSLIATISQLQSRNKELEAENTSFREALGGVRRIVHNGELSSGSKRKSDSIKNVTFQRIKPFRACAGTLCLPARILTFEFGRLSQETHEMCS